MHVVLGVCRCARILHCRAAALERRDVTKSEWAQEVCKQGSLAQWLLSSARPDALAHLTYWWCVHLAWRTATPWALGPGFSPCCSPTFPCSLKQAPQHMSASKPMLTQTSVVSLGACLSPEPLLWAQRWLWLVTKSIWNKWKFLVTSSKIFKCILRRGDQIFLYLLLLLSFFSSFFSFRTLLSSGSNHPPEGSLPWGFP